MMAAQSRSCSLLVTTLLRTAFFRTVPAIEGRGMSLSSSKNSSHLHMTTTTERNEERQQSEQRSDRARSQRSSISETPPRDFLNYSFVTAMAFFSYIIVIATFPLSLFFCIKIIQEYERAVIFRMGKLLPGGTRGPGVFFVLPCVDTYILIDLRTFSYDVPPQEILSKDSVTVSVDAVVYFKTCDPIASVVNVNDAVYSTKLLTQTTLRNVLGTRTLAEMLSDREGIAKGIQAVLDDGTVPWGIKVERVEVKDVRLPPQLTRAMAAEAEASREARAKVVGAEGEQKASKALSKAAEVIQQNPAAMQLRYLQTLSSIAAEHNSTIIFPIPMQLFTMMDQAASNLRPQQYCPHPEVHQSPSGNQPSSPAQDTFQPPPPNPSQVSYASPVIASPTHLPGPSSVSSILKAPATLTANI